MRADLAPVEFEELNEATFEGRLEDFVERSYDPRRQARYRRRLARLERRVGVGRLLEVGAGVGGFLHAARERGWEAVGLEPVAACAGRARELGLEVRTTRVQHARLEPAHYDVVYAHGVLEHLTEPVAALAAMARALRPGGLAYLDTVNADSYTADRLGVDWQPIDPVLHYCLWTPTTLRLACERGGLEVLRLRSHGVRLRPDSAGRPRGPARAWDELRKLPWSVAARLSLRGENVTVLARRPELEPASMPIPAAPLAAG